MDCTEQQIIIASAPLQLLLLQLEGARGGSLPGPATASSRPGSAPQQRRLVAVRELCMFNVGRPVQDVALVPQAAADMARRLLKGARARGLVFYFACVRACVWVC